MVERIVKLYNSVIGTNSPSGSMWDIIVPHYCKDILTYVKK